MSARILSTDRIRARAKPLAAFALSLVFAVTTLPALGQQPQTAPNLPVGPYMWGGPWGWHPFMIVVPIFAVLAIIGIMTIFVWLVRWATRGNPFYGHHGFHHSHRGCPYWGGPDRGRAALDILEERFARGEIDKVEFEDKRKLLGR